MQNTPDSGRIADDRFTLIAKAKLPCDNPTETLDWTNPRIARAGIEIVDWLLTEGARLKEEQQHGESSILPRDL